MDTGVLEGAMVGLLEQHDALRMRYEERKGEDGGSGVKGR